MDGRDSKDVTSVIGNTHLPSSMTASRFEPSSIRNKIKRDEVARKFKKTKSQQKLQKRLAQAKLESKDPALKKVMFIPTAAKKAILKGTVRNVLQKMFLGHSITCESSTRAS